MDIDNLSLRDLQRESARALSTMSSTNDSLSRFNKEAHHNSQRWYRAVIKHYVEQWGDLPSRAGPGKTVKLVGDIGV